METRPAAVDIVIVKEGKILLVKREKEPFKDKWVLPGGFVEINEDVISAAKREAKEETGLDVELIGLIGVYSDPKRDKRHTVSIAYIAIPLTEEIKPQNGETKEVKWFDIEDIPELGFDHNTIVDDALFLMQHSTCSCEECSGCE